MLVKRHLWSFVTLEKLAQQRAQLKRAAQRRQEFLRGLATGICTFALSKKPRTVLLLYSEDGGR
jgi:hypothetical protein